MCNTVPCIPVINSAVPYEILNSTTDAVASALVGVAYLVATSTTNKIDRNSHKIDRNSHKIEEVRQEMKAGFLKTAKKTDGVDRRVSLLDLKVDRNHSEVKTAISELRTMMAELENKMDANQAENSSSMNLLKLEIKEDVENLKSHVENLKSEVENLKSHVGNLKGEVESNHKDVMGAVGGLAKIIMADKK